MARGKHHDLLAWAIVIAIAYYFRVQILAELEYIAGVATKPIASLASGPQSKPAPLVTSAPVTPLGSPAAHDPLVDRMGGDGSASRASLTSEIGGDVPATFLAQSVAEAKAENRYAYDANGDYVFLDNPLAIPVAPSPISITGPGVDSSKRRNLSDGRIPAGVYDPIGAGALGQGFDPFLNFFSSAFRLSPGKGVK